MSNTYRVPAEDEAHELTFMQWPNDRAVYDDPVFLRNVQQTIARIAVAISNFEPVIILGGKKHHEKIKRMCKGAVEIWDVPTDDLWARDSGPIFARDEAGKLAVQNIQFNGWGNKQATPNDNQIARTIAQVLDIPLNATGLIGEGGSTEHDGDEYLIAHQSSWKNDNRNPNMELEEIEERLLKAYGASKMVWGYGVWDLDITDYHIDSLARFTRPGKILMNLPEEADFHDPFHQAALDTFDNFKRAELDIDVIPEPNYRRVKSYDFVASYANYYICNGAVIAAQFGDERTDEIAVEALKRHYPGRKIVTLNVDALGELGGGIHCATQQMPA